MCHAWYMCHVLINCRILSKNVKMKYTRQLCYSLFYIYIKLGALTLRKEHWLKMGENSVSRKIFRPKIHEINKKFCEELLMPKR